MAQMIWYSWTILWLSAIGSCAGNLLLKQANLVLSNPDLLTLLKSPWFIAAIACYIFDLILFTQALHQLPVSVAVPVVSGIRIAATAFLAAVFFDEHLAFNQLFASCLITAGIIVMSHT